MTASSTLPAPNLMPLMRYRNLAEAMGWLEQAFGFEKQIAVSDGDGAVIYGQMTYRGGLIMMGAVRDTDLDKLMRQPDEVGDVETQSCYLVVDDADEHHARSVASGADVVLELKSDGLGRRGYSCRDPEGHIWSFGTYNPGKGLTMTAAQPAVAASEEPLDEPQPRRGRRILMGFAGLLILAGAAGFVMSRDIGGISSRLAHAPATGGEAARAYAELVKVRAEKRLADERAAALASELKSERERLAAERARLAAAKADTAELQKLAQEKASREAAEKALASLREELKREQDARDAAVEAKRVMEEKLATVSASPPPAQAPPEADIAPAKKTEAPPLPALAPEQTSNDRIETSATNGAAAKPEEPAISAADEDVPDADVASKKAKPDPKKDRAAKAAKARRPDAARSRRYPSYVTDMKNTWPYAQWAN